jgi:hypothetical protein
VLPVVSFNLAANACNRAPRARLFRGLHESARITLLKSQFPALFAAAMCGAAGIRPGGCRFGFNL